MHGNPIWRKFTSGDLEKKKRDNNSPLNRYVTITIKNKILLRTATLSGSRNLRFRRPFVSPSSRYSSKPLSNKIITSFNFRNAWKLEHWNCSHVVCVHCVERSRTEFKSRDGAIWPFACTLAINQTWLFVTTRWEKCPSQSRVIMFRQGIFHT